MEGQADMSACIQVSVFFPLGVQLGLIHKVGNSLMSGSSPEVPMQS